MRPRVCHVRACVCERERESVCVCVKERVCVCVCACVYVCLREKEGEIMRERERKRERKNSQRERERKRKRVCVSSRVSQCAHQESPQIAVWCCLYVADSQPICGQTCAWHIDVEDRHSRCERGASNAGTLGRRLGQQV